jgi:DNA-binding NtrC family response regulator
LTLFVSIPSPFLNDRNFTDTQGTPNSVAPFAPVNCSALPRELIESELFGYRQGAFSGATTEYQGLFRAADGGTLFLDEVTEMASDTQAKLLRILTSARHPARESGERNSRQRANYSHVDRGDV